MTTVLPEYALYDIFLSKPVFNLASSAVKYASGSIKLMKPAPATSVLTPLSCGNSSATVRENSAVKVFAISLGF